MFSLNGCTAEKHVDVQTTATARDPLNLPDPSPVSLEPPSWVVLTQNNYEQIFHDMKIKDPNGVLIAITSDDYKKYATNNFKIEQYIVQLNKNLASYQNYYEPPKKNN